MADRKKTTLQRLTNGRLNRKQRRDLQRQLSVEEPGLEIVTPEILPPSQLFTSRALKPPHWTASVAAPESRER